MSVDQNQTVGSTVFGGDRWKGLVYSWICVSGGVPGKRKNTPVRELRRAQRYSCTSPRQRCRKCCVRASSFLLTVDHRRHSDQMSLFQQPAKNIPPNPSSTIPYADPEMFLHFFYFQLNKQTTTKNTSPPMESSVSMAFSKIVNSKINSHRRRQAQPGLTAAHEE